MKKKVLTLNQKMLLSQFEKNSIQDYFQPIIEKFKSQFIVEKPDKEFDFLVDFYLIWRKNYLYFCEKYKSEHPNRIKDEYEMKFLRLKYSGKNNFELSYFRHTGVWQLVMDELTLDDCKEMILTNPVFHPIG